MLKIKFYIVVILCSIPLSCIEENISSMNNEIILGNSELILRDLEDSGDFINSAENPPLLEAAELNDNIDNYLILDIRTDNEFKNGHIKNSKNVNAKDLIDYLNNINWENFSKIVLVSQTGQHAIYCATLLRLSQFYNIYSLNFGISIWNRTLADNYLKSLDQQTLEFIMAGEDYPEMTDLPKISDFDQNDIKLSIRNRANQLLNNNFEEFPVFSDNNNMTISYLELIESEYKLIPGPKGGLIKHIKDNNFVLCYGSTSFYTINNAGNGHSHPPQTVKYIPYDGIVSNLRSSEYLQTIPSNKNIFIYSYSGQRSALLTAYLRMLGYKARSVALGGQNMLYYDMLLNNDLSQFCFFPNNINDYEVIK